MPIKALHASQPRGLTLAASPIRGGLGSYSQSSLRHQVSAPRYSGIASSQTPNSLSDLHTSLRQMPNHRSSLPTVSTFAANAVASSSQIGLRQPVKKIPAVRGRSAGPPISGGELMGAGMVPDEQLKNLPRVIFLDVDGVLHGIQGQYARQQFQRPQMNLLAEIQRLTNAQIVLSSAWRLNPMARGMVDKTLRSHGIPTFISRTPCIGTFQRAREILSWVSQYQPKTWVAIDDWDLYLEGLEQVRGHFVRTNSRTGLTQKDLEMVIELFRRQGSDDGVPASPASSLSPSIRRNPQRGYPPAI